MPALCYEIMAEGGAKYVKNFLLENDSLAGIPAPAVYFLNELKICSFSLFFFFSPFSNSSVIYKIICEPQTMLFEISCIILALWVQKWI